MRRRRRSPQPVPVAGRRALSRQCPDPYYFFRAGAFLAAFLAGFFTAGFLSWATAFTVAAANTAAITIDRNLSIVSLSRAGFMEGREDRPGRVTCGHSLS